MAGREDLEFVAQIVHRLQFRGHDPSPRRIASPIKRHDPDRIACDQVSAARCIPQNKGEDAVQRPGQCARLHLLIKRQNDLAIRGGAQRVAGGVQPLQFGVIVDLAVDRQHRLIVGPVQRLRAAFGVDNGQSFVGQDGPVVLVHPAPVRAAVALPARARQHVGTQRGRFVANVQNAEDRAHRGFPCRAQTRFY